MKQRLAFIFVIALALAAISYSEYRKADVAVSSEPIFHLVGDTQQELTRLPVAFTRISDEEEIQIGNRLAQSYQRIWQDEIKKNADYTEAQAYVAQVGARVATHTRRKLPYTFHYIPDDGFVNAFALPGGHVFIGQGLIHLMDSEDELAAVLGHEVEHADLGHCAERVQLEARLRSLHIGELAASAWIPYEVFAAGYSKEQELAADRDGTQLAVASGYSPMGAVRMFETFEQFEPQRAKAHSPQQELSSVALQSLQEYFRDHPRSSERVAQVQQMIATQHWPLVAERDLRIGFIALTLESQSALLHHEYDRARAIATRSLSLKPNQIAPLDVVYWASMYTGEFPAAADAARKLLTAAPDSIVYAQQFAEAIAAEKSGEQAATQFETATASNTRPADLRLRFNAESAGLRLLAGDESHVRKLLSDILQPRDQERSSDGQTFSTKQAGEILGRIGHWYYLAGRYDEAMKRLDESHEFSPDLPGLMSELGWAAVQNNKIATAQTSFQASATPDSVAGRAVTLWRSEDKDGAVLAASSLSSDTRWKNERWVSSTYGASVFRTLTEIENERQRRITARK
jgi:beta-barrel assembly-enhancing protease